ncbi:MAG TPA: DUF2911 domain-containing protein [Mucilaginibacter sp.]|nr:DUF2911 domain-containing protein [Mucilaginibacter sp.]
MTKYYSFVIALLLSAAGFSSYAQAPRIPEASPTQTIIQDFGLGKITITYSRPSVKDRLIFGGINPYGQVWRTGANAATTISFTENVVVEGHSVPAGTYALFTIPERDVWTIILNKTAKQWGAYSYDQSQDLLRFKVKPIYRAEKRESFTIQFADVNTHSADLHLVWDHTAVSIKLNTDDQAKIIANIDELMKGDRKPYYFNAIQYYYENNQDLNKALGWAMEAERVEPESPWFKLWEARIRLKMGQAEEAIKAAEAGVALARASHDDEYERLNQAVLNRAKAKLNQ